MHRRVELIEPALRCKRCLCTALCSLYRLTPFYLSVNKGHAESYDNQHRHQQQQSQAIRAFSNMALLTTDADLLKTSKTANASPTAALIPTITTTATTTSPPSVSTSNAASSNSSNSSSNKNSNISVSVHNQRALFGEVAGVMNNSRGMYGSDYFGTSESSTSTVANSTNYGGPSTVG